MTANVMGSTRRIGSIAGTDTELVPGTVEIRNKLMAATRLGPVVARTERHGRFDRGRARRP